MLFTHFVYKTSFLKVNYKMVSKTISCNSAPHILLIFVVINNTENIASFSGM